MVDELRKQGIEDERVLAAILKIPRHEFVEEAWQGEAYRNKPLPIGQAQTISQPYVVALMTQALFAGAAARKRILEIGTGSGYQTAVLAELAPNVFSVERLKGLSEIARDRLKRLGYRNIHFGYADGHLGFPAHGPFDGIIVTAAAAEVPKALLEQLAPTGRLVIPVGPANDQRLRIINRTARGLKSEEIAAVSFVPLLEGRG
jgi:protein-L-isoaspartate(D-aspartate) O-methyltransferase